MVDRNLANTERKMSINYHWLSTHVSEINDKLCFGLKMFKFCMTKSQVGLWIYKEQTTCSVRIEQKGVSFSRL